MNSEPFQSLVKQLIQTPTPLVRVSFPVAEAKGIDVFVKRDDLTHADISGNKWRKLKYNLIRATELGHKTLLTVGGGHSNHIHAVASAGKHFGFDTVGIIRQSTNAELTPTLIQAQAAGMSFQFVTREEYRRRDSAAFLDYWRATLGEFYFLPEGGTNSLALPGCAELIAELDQQLPNGYDVVCVPVGSGGTLAGIASALAPGKTAMGISVVNDKMLPANIANLCNDKGKINWVLNSDYIFGDYGKVTPELIHFMQQFHALTGIPLEPVYTGKLFYGVQKLIEQDTFVRGTRIVVVHTGGLQGNRGYSDRFDVDSWSHSDQ